MFDREFIKSGIFDKELSKILHRSFELRQKADYMEQPEITKADIDEILPKTVSFINEIKQYILKNK